MLHPSLIAVTDVLATTPGVMFSVKSPDGVYLSANRAFAERAGVAGPGDVIGRTAHDLFPPELAATYEAQDREVLATGRMLSNELELIASPHGEVGWYLTSKSRWLAEGEVQGLVSVSVDLKAPVDAAAPHPKLAAVVEAARTRYREPVSVTELAALAGMTVTQLERLSRRIIGLTPKQLILRFRLEDALGQLATTDATLAEIAQSSGYYDQSSFNRHFRRVVGCTPTEWRASVRGPDR